MKFFSANSENVKNVQNAMFSKAFFELSVSLSVDGAKTYKTLAILNGGAPG